MGFKKGGENLNILAVKVEVISNGFLLKFEDDLIKVFCPDTKIVLKKINEYLQANLK